MGITMSQREWGTGSLKTREGEASGISAEKQGFKKEEEQIQAQRQRGSPLPSPRMVISHGGSGARGKAVIPSSLSDIQEVRQRCYQSYASQDANHDAGHRPN